MTDDRPARARMVEAVEQIVSAWAFAHNIDGAARNDLFTRLRATMPTPPAEPGLVREALERAAQIAESYATCGCEGKHGACMVDDVPKAIADEIRALSTIEPGEG